MTRSRAIREMCLNCAGGTNKELTLCHWREMINALETYVKHAVFSEKRALHYLVWLKGL